MVLLTQELLCPLLGIPRAEFGAPRAAQGHSSARTAKPEAKTPIPLCVPRRPCGNEPGELGQSALRRREPLLTGDRSVHRILKSIPRLSVRIWTLDEFVSEL
jgi:hypothetical protein